MTTPTSGRNGRESLDPTGHTDHSDPTRAPSGEPELVPMSSGDGPESYLPGGAIADSASSARIGGGATLGAVGQADVAVTGEGHGLAADPDGADVAVTGKTALIVRRTLRNKGAVAGLIMLAFAVLFVLLGNIGNPYSYSDQDLVNLGSAPGIDGHRLGTNAGGIDLWAMLVRGTGKSLLIAAVVGIVSPLIAAVYGTAIAFWGGTREKVGMWVLDMLILMPYFLIVAVLMGQTGGGALQLALILTLFGWMGIARVVRATTQSLREREFVQAARYMGVSDWQIIRRHIIPNLGSYLILHIVLGTFGAIIAETALSFLGVGVRPPDVSLGQLIGQSASQISAYPWLFWGPTVCLLWLTVSLALIGDGLRDALDPNSASGGKA